MKGLTFDNDGDLELFGEKIARDIMSVGDEPNSPTKRIQFLAGKYPDNEIEQGGLCKQALVMVINRSIRKMIDGHKEETKQKAEVVR